MHSATQLQTVTQGIVFVSLGAAIMTPAFIDFVVREAEGECESLNIFLLDVPEMINVRNLQGIREEELWPAVATKAEELVSGLKGHYSIRTIISRWSEYAQHAGFPVYKESVLKTYETESRFRRHCLNQTFHNLQPILRRQGIRRKTDQLVAKLTEYLCLEIAMKLYIADSSLAQVEFAPAPEMEIVRAIYEGQYQSLSDCARRRMRFITVKYR